MSTARRRPHGLRRAIVPLLLIGLLGASGCITLEMGGAGRGEMQETVVHGDGGPKVLLIDIDGEITDSDAAGILGWVLSEGTVSRVADQLALAERKGDIAAVIVRIDSPGGSPTASDAVHRMLVEFKKEQSVPVRAQMMAVAASGGYYVAMAADEVVANRTTVTGSIGVIMLGVNLSGLMDKIGVENQTFTSGPYKDAGSFLRPMSDAERRQLQSVVDDLHHQFVNVVDEGRPKLSTAQVAGLADGRIYSASQALEAGLIDRIGALESTIEATRQQLGATEVRVVAYHRPREAPSNVYSRSGLVHRDVDLGAESPLARLLPRPGFYYLWWPGVQ